MDLMRQLEDEHKRLWENLSPLKPEMVATSDCDPVLLSGWTDRDISLWDVSGLDGKPGLKDILVALCRKKKDWKKIIYLRFPRETVSKAGLSLTASNGNTGDQRVDTSQTHFEIKGITGKGLCTLLFRVSSGEFETGVFTKRELEDILYRIYDSVSARQVVQSATSQTPLPPSGTGVQAAITVEVPEQAVGEKPITDKMPRPSSSTISE